MATHTMLVEPTKRSFGWHRAGVGRTAPIDKAVERQRDLGRPHRVSLETAELSAQSLSGVARANNEDRARRLLEQRLEHVYHRDFDEPNAEARFLAPMPAGSHRASASPRHLTGLSAYVADPCGDATLLRPEEETYLFLKMNYLKYRASKLRDALVPSLASQLELAEIERFLVEALAVKHHIVRSNVGLVVSIAKKQARPDRNVFELESEGYLSLMLAVEKFDASRGFKFSTYATCAIARNLARATGQQIGRRRRFVTGHQELLEAAAAPRNDEHGHDDGRNSNQQEAVCTMLGRLSDRERGIIVGRFGLDGASEKTFRQLGEELGITKERVRQIESRAREKLRKLALEQGLDPTAA
jgi:RNA polymerase primary sigma factor